MDKAKSKMDRARKEMESLARNDDGGFDEALFRSQNQRFMSTSYNV